MPIAPRAYVPIPFAGRPRQTPDTRTLGAILLRQGQDEVEAARVKGAMSAQLWQRFGEMFSNFAQGRRAEQQQATTLAQRKSEQDADAQLKRDEMDARKAERDEAARIRKEAEQERKTAAAEKRGAAIAEEVGYGPMSETQMEGVLEGPAAGRARYAFGPGTADGPELLPTREQSRMIDAETAVKGMGGVIGPNGQIVMPPKPTAPKALQRETALVNGRPTIVNFNPETGTYSNQKGEAVEVEYMPPARSGGDGGPRPLTQTAEAALITRLSRDWSAQSKPTRELERQVRIMDAGMEAVRRGDMSQGAQMVLTTFQKILDPPSVVRESEFMRSAQGQSVMNRAQGAYERLLKGGQGVTAGELQKFADLARETARAQQGSYLGRVKDRIGRTASRYSIPLELVFEEDGTEDSPAPPAPVAPVKPKVGRDANGNLVAPPKGGQ